MDILEENLQTMVGELAQRCEAAIFATEMTVQVTLGLASTEGNSVPNTSSRLY